MSYKIKTTVAGGVVLIAVTIGWFVVSNNRDDKENWRTVQTTRQDVIQDVIFTGRLKSQQVSKLSFESTGAISELYVGVGEEVNMGQPLAKLETRAVEISQAKSSSDRAWGQELKKIAMEKAEQEWKNTVATNVSIIESKKQAVRDKKKELDQYRTVHQQIAAEQGEDNSTTRTYVTSIKLAQTAYHNAQRALVQAMKSAQQTEETARQAVDLAKAEYESTTQAADGVAGISSLEALEKMDQYRLTKKTLLAPFNGVVTAVDKELGETAITGETVITVETVDQLELSANVTETDAAKVMVNMEATVGFDALPVQEKWAAIVTRVSPAAKITDGVPTYEITLQLKKKDNRFKPGLTANVTVHARAKYDVIAVPRRAVVNKEGKQLVRVVDETGAAVEQKIVTGLIGSTGIVEVISGLKEGQEVVVGSRQLKQ